LAANQSNIADGHHRYTTALTYMQNWKSKTGGALPPNHRQLRMFALIGMQDDGLLILPTHRLIGNIESFNIEAFSSAAEKVFDVTGVAVAPRALPHTSTINSPKPAAHRLACTMGDPNAVSVDLQEPRCAKGFGAESERSLTRLDVAILQRYLLDEIIQPNFAGTKELTKRYTAESEQVVPMTDGAKSQIALLLKSTPLNALEQLGHHNEVMPQKSTYFFPKLATGMVMDPVGV